MDIILLNDLTVMLMIHKDTDEDIFNRAKRSVEDQNNEEEESLQHKWLSHKMTLSRLMDCLTILRKDDGLLGDNLKLQ